MDRIPGTSTGINSIPSALTIQNGNLSDKKHFRFLLRMAEAILEPNSILIFDCGANTRDNKELMIIRNSQYQGGYKTPSGTGAGGL